MKISPYSVSNYTHESVSKKWFSTTPTKRSTIQKIERFAAKQIVGRVAAVARPFFALFIDLPGNLVLGALKAVTCRFTGAPDLRRLKKGMVKEHFKASGQAVINTIKGLVFLIPTLCLPRLGFNNLSKRHPEKLNQPTRFSTSGAQRQEKQYQDKKDAGTAQRAAARLQREEEKKNKEYEQAVITCQKVGRGYIAREKVGRLRAKVVETELLAKRERDLAAFVKEERIKQMNQYLMDSQGQLQRIGEGAATLREKNSSSFIQRATSSIWLGDKDKPQDPIESIEESVGSLKSTLPLSLEAPITDKEKEQYRLQRKKTGKAFLALPQDEPSASSKNDAAYLRRVMEEANKRAKERLESRPDYQVLQLMNEHLSPELGGVFSYVFQAYKNKGIDIVRSFEHSAKDQTFSIEFAQSVQFWVDSKEDNGKDYPVGGVIILMGKDRKMTGTVALSKNGDKTLEFTEGLYSYSKNPEGGIASKVLPKPLCKINKIVYTKKGKVVTHTSTKNLPRYVPGFADKGERKMTRTIATVKKNWETGNVVDGDYKDYLEGVLDGDA